MTDETPGSDGETEWPKTVRVGGETHKISPGMPFYDYIDLADALTEEVEKVRDLQDEMGVDFDGDEL